MYGLFGKVRFYLRKSMLNNSFKIGRESQSFLSENANKRFKINHLIVNI